MPRPHISASLTQAQIDEIKTKVDEIKSILKFGVNLTPKERIRMRKMGPKSVFYVDLGLTVAQNHPAVIPTGFSVNDFQEDVLLSKALEEVFVLLAPLNEMLDDTRKLVGMECMKQADIIYNIVKLSAKDDEELGKIKVQLAERFKDMGANRGNPKRKRKSRAKQKQKDNE